MMRNANNAIIAAAPPAISRWCVALASHLNVDLHRDDCHKNCCDGEFKGSNLKTSAGTCRVV